MSPLLGKKIPKYVPSHWRRSTLLPVLLLVKLTAKPFYDSITSLFSPPGRASLSVCKTLALSIGLRIVFLKMATAMFTDCSTSTTTAAARFLPLNRDAVVLHSRRSVPLRFGPINSSLLRTTVTKCHASASPSVLPGTFLHDPLQILAL